MKRIACVLAAFGLIAAAATPAWAHHSHHGHYHGGYYGHYYNSYCNGYVSQGNAWDAQGNYDSAIAAYTQAIAYDTNCALAYAQRGAVWYEKGEYEKAIADDTNCAAYYNDLAFFQATCLDPHYRDAKRAFENASKAYQLSNGNNTDNNFSVLASAYAENGDFDQALQWQGKAIDLTKDGQMKQRYLARVELFKQGKPFRFDPKSALQNPVAAN